MYRCSECGRTISSKMRGVCMACRYAEIRRREGAKGEKAGTARIKVDATKLPEPLLRRLAAYRGGLCCHRL